MEFDPLLDFPPNSFDVIQISFFAKGIFKFLRLPKKLLQFYLDLCAIFGCYSLASVEVIVQCLVNPQQFFLIWRKVPLELF